MWRFNIGPGLGYFFIKKPDASLLGELGVSYIRENFERVDPSDYYALRIAEQGEWKISKTSKVWEKAEYLPDISDFAEPVHLKRRGRGRGLDDDQGQLKTIGSGHVQQQTGAGAQQERRPLHCGGSGTSLNSHR